MHEYAVTAVVCRDILITPLDSNFFSLILKNKMAAKGIFQLLAKSFVGPLE